MLSLSQVLNYINSITRWIELFGRTATDEQKIVSSRQSRLFKHLLTTIIKEQVARKKGVGSVLCLNRQSFVEASALGDEFISSVGVRSDDCCRRLSGRGV
jgi:hypothetical protein